MSALYTQAEEEKKKRPTPLSRAAMSMCVLVSTESIQSALLCSMKPMPPMSAANWNTASTPSAARRQLALSFRSSERFSTPRVVWYHSVRRFYVDSPHNLNAVCNEVLDQMSADEATRSTDDRFLPF